MRERVEWKNEEIDKIEKLFPVLPHAGPLLSCLVTAIHWAFLLN